MYGAIDRDCLICGSKREGIVAGGGGRGGQIIRNTSRGAAFWLNISQVELGYGRQYSRREQ